MKQIIATLALSLLLTPQAFAQQPASVPPTAPAMPSVPSLPRAATATGTVETAPTHTRVESISGLSVSLTVGTTRVVTLNGDVASVVSAQPSIVVVKPLSDRRLALIGAGEGVTTVTAVSADGSPITQFTVVVSPSGYAAGAISAALPQGASAVAIPGGVRLQGQVQSPLDAMQAAKSAAFIAGPGKVENDLAVSGTQQVVLKVKIAQMSRSVTQQLGINWQSLGGPRAGLLMGAPLAGGSLAGETVGNLINVGQPGAYAAHIPHTNLDAILNALDEDNLAHLLAEPTLTALSGHTASFISGGSFPVPLPPGPNGQAGIEFKDYGVQLQFRPVVLANGEIFMHVKPTVSQISNLNSVSITAGNTTLVVPSLLEQSADTTVVLGSGQTLAIAGLLETRSSQGDTSVPGLGSVPVLGGAFRNDSFTRSEDEIVVLVTPYTVRPRSNPNAFQVPGQDWTPPNLVERFFLARQSGGPPRPRKFPANVGFLLQ